MVAIPAKDEAERIGPCLAALAAQDGAPLPRVLVLLNNCTDESEQVVRDFARASPMRVDIDVRTLPPAQASAGVARSLAMALAARLVPEDGVVLTTDADSSAPPSWIAANLAALRNADAVAGRALIDPEEAKLIPAILHEDDARECAYATLLDEIASLLDPDPADPWPRHDEHSGASIAVRREGFRRAGGMPNIPSGEDRAFFAALRRNDARIRHAPDVWVTVSGRIEGRATGGMADTIRRRIATRDTWLDDRLETADAAARRARLRHMARLVHCGADPDPVAASLLLPSPTIRAALERGPFGMGWEMLEAESPALRRRPVPVSDLAVQTARATAMRDALLRRGRADPVDTLRVGRPASAVTRARMRA